MVEDGVQTSDPILSSPKCPRANEETRSIDVYLADGDSIVAGLTIVADIPFGSPTGHIVEVENLLRLLTVADRVGGDRGSWRRLSSATNNPSIRGVADRFLPRSVRVRTGK